MQSTLVLNASYEPLNIVSTKRAINLILNGKAVAVDNSERLFHSAIDSIEIPYVIRLSNMIKRKHYPKAAFSRRGVLVRDNFTCVYCKKDATTIDHVVPSSAGGLSTYENCVAACLKCNNKKDNKTLEALGWTLPMVPRSPSAYVSLLRDCKRNHVLYTTWARHIEPWAGVKLLV